MPREGGALDAGREGMDARERGQVADLLRLLARRDDLVELPVELLGLGGRLSLELGGHERRARLGYGAPRPLEGDLGNPVAVQAKENVALVPARGVVPVGRAVGGGYTPPVARPAVV